MTVQEYYWKRINLNLDRTHYRFTLRIRFGTAEASLSTIKYINIIFKDGINGSFTLIDKY